MTKVIPVSVDLTENTKTGVFRCDCGEEMLVVDGTDGAGIDISIWARQFDKTTLRHRLHLIWRIIRHGRPYIDQICLSYEKADKLARFLKKVIKEEA